MHSRDRGNPGGEAGGKQSLAVRYDGKRDACGQGRPWVTLAAL